jgi:G3E family GTPase
VHDEHCGHEVGHDHGAHDARDAQHDHRHDDEIASVSLSAARPMDHDALIRWLEDLVAARGRDILRLKGIIDLQGQAKRFVVQGVHMLLEADFQRPWQEGEVRDSRLVLIGRNLDANGLQAGFAACQAPVQGLSPGAAH